MAEQLRVEWSPHARWMWLALPVFLLVVLLCGEPWTPLLWVCGVAALPFMLGVSCGLTCLCFDVMAILGGMFLRWARRPAAPAPPPQQACITYSVCNSTIRTRRPYKSGADSFMLTADGREERCSDEFGDSRIGLTLAQLTEDEKKRMGLSDASASQAYLTRYAAYFVTVAYGPGKTKIARVRGTMMEYAWDAATGVSHLVAVHAGHWFSRFTDTSKALRALYRAEWKEPKRDTESARATTDFANYDRKVASHLFVDRFEYSTGHQLIRTSTGKQRFSVEQVYDNGSEKMLVEC